MKIWTYSMVIVMYLAGLWGLYNLSNNARDAEKRIEVLEMRYEILESRCLILESRCLSFEHMIKTMTKIVTNLAEADGILNKRITLLAQQSEAEAEVFKKAWDKFIKGWDDAQIQRKNSNAQ